MPGVGGDYGHGAGCLRAESVRSWSPLVLLLPPDEITPNKLTTPLNASERPFLVRQEGPRSVVDLPPSWNVPVAHGWAKGAPVCWHTVPSGGSVEMNGGYRFLDVDDPAAMKARLDDVTLANFRAAAERALARSGATLADVSYLCGIHMKRSAHDGLVATLGLDPSRAAYPDDTGHMSGVDPLLALDRAARGGELADGDLVLLLAAGTGYTWAASVVRWGRGEE